MPPKGKAKARPKAKPRAMAKVHAKAKARPLAMRVRRGVLARPAAREGGEAAMTAEQKWTAGDLVSAVGLPAVEFSEGVGIVIPQAQY